MHVAGLHSSSRENNSMLTVLVAEAVWYNKIYRHDQVSSLPVSADRAVFVQENKHRDAFLANEGQIAPAADEMPNTPVKAQAVNKGQVVAPLQVRPPGARFLLR